MATTDSLDGTMAETDVQDVPSLDRAMRFRLFHVRVACARKSRHARARTPQVSRRINQSATI